MSQTSQAGPSNGTAVSYTPQMRVTKESYTNPLVAQGDGWTRSLVQLAKTAELKKHALTLQVHTAHILSAHASLDEKGKALQDVKEQKNRQYRLESERTRLLNCLREVNEDRDKVDILETTINKECDDLRAKIKQITDGDYAAAKHDVDMLRQELGQEPLPSLQHMLDEKNAAYLRGRRLSANGESANINTNKKRMAPTPKPDEIPATGETPAKRPRGRPRGSKNKNKPAGTGDEGTG
ncbi:hypothetical protein BU17DRAFT_49642 [Hysterangium stoloniferum]|nr:hypothetical protein BU17DRAFT_49642 [Hysterangium stoloniferum]